jgi:hypothetical protein
MRIRGGTSDLTTNDLLSVGTTDKTAQPKTTIRQHGVTADRHLTSTLQAMVHGAFGIDANTCDVMV